MPFPSVVLLINFTRLFSDNWLFAQSFLNTGYPRTKFAESALSRGSSFAIFVGQLPLQEDRLGIGLKVVGPWVTCTAYEVVSIMPISQNPRLWGVKEFFVLTRFADGAFVRIGPPPLTSVSPLWNASENWSPSVPGVNDTAVLLGGAVGFWTIAIPPTLQLGKVLATAGLQLVGGSVTLSGLAPSHPNCTSSIEAIHMLLYYAFTSLSTSSIFIPARNTSVCISGIISVTESFVSESDLQVITSLPTAAAVRFPSAWTAARWDTNFQDASLFPSRSMPDRINTTISFSGSRMLNFDTLIFVLVGGD